MDRYEEAHHLVSLFRQSNDAERRELLREMLETAVAQISPRHVIRFDEGQLDDEERNRLADLTWDARHQRKASGVILATASVAENCSFLLARGAPIDPTRFAHVVLAWSRMDKKGGRPRSLETRILEETARQCAGPAEEVARLAEKRLGRRLSLSPKSIANVVSHARNSRQSEAGN